MDTIEAEMNANDGIYPMNGGAVSKNEVARRAGIGITTLFSPKQKKLGKKVDLWLITLKKKETVGRERVRRTYAERAEDWKERYLALQDSHVKTELDLMEALAEKEKAVTEAQNLRDEKALLLEQLRLAGAKNVTAFPKEKH